MYGQDTLSPVCLWDYIPATGVELMDKSGFPPETQEKHCYGNSCLHGGLPSEMEELDYSIPQLLTAYILLPLCAVQHQEFQVSPFYIVPVSCPGPHHVKHYIINARNQKAKHILRLYYREMNTGY